MSETKAVTIVFCVLIVAIAIFATTAIIQNAKRDRLRAERGYIEQTIYLKRWGAPDSTEIKP